MSDLPGTLNFISSSTVKLHTNPPSVFENEFTCTFIPSLIVEGPEVPSFQPTLTLIDDCLDNECKLI